MQTMAKNYMDMVRFARKLPHKVAVVMAGSPSCRLVLDPEIFKQINSLRWSDYEMDESDGPYSPLPFNLFESMRVRLWANVKAIKQHVHAMNLNYNRVTNERRISLGKTRPAAFAVGIVPGRCHIPEQYWALWVRKGTANLFYRTVTPRVVSADQGRYTKTTSIKVKDESGCLRTEAIERCHLSHMKEIYRAVA